MNPIIKQIVTIIILFTDIIHYDISFVIAFYYYFLQPMKLNLTPIAIFNGINIPIERHKDEIRKCLLYRNEILYLRYDKEMVLVRPHITLDGFSSTADDIISGRRGIYYISDNLLGIIEGLKMPNINNTKVIDCCNIDNFQLVLTVGKILKCDFNQDFQEIIEYECSPETIGLFQINGFCYKYTKSVITDLNNNFHLVYPTNIVKIMNGYILDDTGRLSYIDINTATINYLLSNITTMEICNEHIYVASKFFDIYRLNLKKSYTIIPHIRLFNMFC